MLLPWRPVAPGDGPAIETSLTAREAATLVDLAAGKRVLEIGSAYGYSAILMALAGATVVAVDPHGGYGSLPGSLPRMRENVAAYGVENRVEIIRCSSADCREHVDASYYDVVFVDGDHRLHAVRADIELAGWAADLDAALAFHDHGETSCPDVAEALDGRWPEGPHMLVDTLAVYWP